MRSGSMLRLSGPTTTGHRLRIYHRGISMTQLQARLPVSRRGGVSLGLGFPMRSLHRCTDHTIECSRGDCGSLTRESAFVEERMLEKRTPMSAQYWVMAKRGGEPMRML